MIYIMRGVYTEEQQQYQYLQNTKIYLQTVRLRWITQQMMANRLMVNKQCLVPAQRPMDLSGAQSAGNETTLARRTLGTGVQVYSDHPDNRTLSGSHYHSLLTNPSHLILIPQSSIMISQAEKQTRD